MKINKDKIVKFIGSILAAAALVFIQSMSSNLNDISDTVGNNRMPYSDYYEIQIAYEDATNHEQIIELTEQFQADRWSSQLGVLLALCNHDTDFLNALFGEDTATDVCRIVN